jgi:tetrahydromethanopterin S-methyltransferase subunit G
VPVTEQQFEAVCERLDDIARNLEHLTHGNGRKGLWALSDAVFGPPGRNEAGLIRKVEDLADARQAELNQRIGSERTLKQIRALILFLIALFGVGGGITVTRLFELVAAH